MKEGQCIHLSSGICTEGKYQNYPCPYRNDPCNCICSIRVTKEMVEQFKETGCVSITYERR
jgi:hypothetical protein